MSTPIHFPDDRSAVSSQTNSACSSVSNLSLPELETVETLDSMESDEKFALSSTPTVNMALSMYSSLPTDEDVQRMADLQLKSKTKKFDQEYVSVPANTEQTCLLREVICDHLDKIMTYSSHVRRERELALMPHVMNSVSRWILVPDKDREGCDIRCSVTIAKNTAYLALPDKEVDEIPAFYAGAAATPLQHRKKGYADKLLGDLAMRLAPAPGKFLALQWYSDADALFSKLNPVVTPSWYCYIRKSEFRKISTLGSANAKYIHEDHIEDIVVADKAMMKEELVAISKETGKPVLVVTPDADCIRFRCVQGRLALTYAMSASATPDPAWQVCGARLGEHGTPDFAFVLWRLTILNLKREDQILYIVRMRFTTTEQLKALMTAACEVAKSWGCGGGIQWLADCKHLPNIEELGIEHEPTSASAGIAMSKIVYNGKLEGVDLENHELLTVDKYTMG